MLGAYFGTAPINEGAAGLGQDGQLHAYADGVIGGSAPNAEMPGPLKAYQDGSLGSLGDDTLHACADGVIGGSANDPEMPGPLTAYHDGSLGDLAQEDQEISVFQDGSLGARRLPGPAVGPLQAYQDGVLGAYRRAMGDASRNVFDMGNPAALKEVKMAMALLAPEVALTERGQEAYTQDWYLTEIWEPEASLLWQAVLAKAPQGSDFSTHGGAQVFPNAAGIGWMAATIGAPQSGALGPAYLAENFPAMNAWLLAGGGTVLPPFLSITDKVKGRQGGASPMQAGMMLYGVGAAAVLGLALLLKKRKR